MITTSNQFPIISLRNYDGTWTEQDYVFRDYEFSPDDGVDAESLTEWLREIVADNGEGEWSASFRGIESDVVCTGPTVDDIVRIARDCPHADINTTPNPATDVDDVTITFADGTEMVIGREAEGGYTWTTYSAQEYDHQPLMERYLTTDGDSTIATLADTIRKQAAK